jgi:PHD-finger
MATERVDLDNQEDRYSDQLKIWCIRVRSLVLVPSNQENADCSRPFPDGSLSQPMLALFKDAEALGIAKFQDVHHVANGLRCICWASLAMSTLARRCSLKEIQHVLNGCSAITLSDEKAIKMLKLMVQRSTLWQAKARKALTPKPGETKPFSMELLNSLEFGSNTLPFEMPEITCLANAIEDKGCRHCLCGGPNDGTFMLGCDKCEGWFHGRCVKVSNETGSNLDHWSCPRCQGEKIDLANFYVDEFEPAEIEDDGSANQEFAPCAPTIEKLWPPFKLLGSTESVESLGEECLMIPDAVGHFEVLHDALVRPCSAVMDQTLLTSLSQTLTRAIPVSSFLVAPEFNTYIGAPSSSPILPDPQTIANICTGPREVEPAASANMTVDVTPLSPDTVKGRAAMDIHMSSHSISPPIIVLVDDSESAHSQAADTIAKSGSVRSCGNGIHLPDISATAQNSTASVDQGERDGCSRPDDTLNSIECGSQAERVDRASASRNEFSDDDVRGHVGVGVDNSTNEPPGLG